MEANNVASSSRTVNSASDEQGESFNFPNDEDEIVIKGAYRFASRLESKLIILCTGSTALKDVEEDIRNFLPPRALPSTAAFSIYTDEISEGESDSDGSDESASEVDEDDPFENGDFTSVDFSSLASSLATSMWPRDVTLALLKGASTSRILHSPCESYPSFDRSFQVSLPSTGRRFSR
jgi:hypothetical protein